MIDQDFQLTQGKRPGERPLGYKRFSHERAFGPNNESRRRAGIPARQRESHGHQTVDLGFITIDSAGSDSTTILAGTDARPTESLRLLDEKPLCRFSCLVYLAACVSAFLAS